VLLALLLHPGRALPPGCSAAAADAGVARAAQRPRRNHRAAGAADRLGGWVSTNYAVLACTQFPTCQDSWWPAMNFAQGFEIWRHLGVTGEGQPLELLSAHRHSLRAPADGLCGVRRARRAGVAPAPHRPLRPQARWLAGLALLQVATGLGNVLLGWPLAAAVLHTGGAAALAVVLTWALARAAAAAAHASDNACGQQQPKKGHCVSAFPMNPSAPAPLRAPRSPFSKPAPRTCCASSMR
jgi:hypothetical protein